MLHARPTLEEISLAGSKFLYPRFGQMLDTRYAILDISIVTVFILDYRVSSIFTLFNPAFVGTIRDGIQRGKTSSIAKYS
jgi:hypothetical protein